MILNKLLSLVGLERKESRALSALIGLGFNDAPIWTPVDYERRTLQSYGLNADVYACVNLIAGEARQIPWLVYTEQDGKEVPNNHPLLMLLKKPNERDTEGSFVEAAIAYLLLTGNSYIERSGGEEKTKPAFLYPLRPDRVTVLPGTRRNIVGGYQYAPGGKPVRFEPWEILHIKSFNPLNDFYGMSPIDAAMYTIACANESRSLYKKLLQRGYPPGAISVDGEDWTDEQIKDFKSGYERAIEGNRILYLGNAKWQQMGFNPVDGSIFEGRKFDKRDIASVFRVPPEMIGDTEHKNYANAREARRGLYTEAVIPSRLQLRDALNNWLGPLFGNAYIDIDRDAIDALAEDRDTAAARVHKLWTSDLIKRNEGRGELKYEAVPEDEDGYYSELVKRNEGQADTEIQIPPQMDENPGSRKPRLVVGKPQLRQLREASSTGGDYLSLKAFNLISEEEKASHSHAVEQARERWYAAIQADAEERFLDERNAVLRAFSEGQEAAAIKAVTRQESAWTKLYRLTYLNVSDEFGRRMLQSIKSDGYEHEVKFEEDVFTRTVLAWLADEGAKRVTGVLDTTKEKIRRELVAGVTAGETTYELSKRLESMYGQFSLYRAERISRTEVISASNLGSQTAARGTNLPLEKDWIATFDNRTRDPHAAAHGQRRPINEPYVVMGQRLMFPGDGSLGASTENLVMCRCSESYKIQRG